MIKFMREVSQVMEDVYGMNISMYDESFLLKLIEQKAITAGIKGISEYITYLSNNAAEAKSLYCSLNINYSEFFRNRLAFALLEQWILPKLIMDKPTGSELRIWSAGCAYGQEAYSLAMLLDKLKDYQGHKVSYRIIATDISHSSLTLASKGEYQEELIQNMRIKDLKEFFVDDNKTYKIVPRLKQHITFAYYDLLDKFTSNPQESIFGNFDLIFCSNLLYYYQPEHQQFILQKIIRALSANGYLITGETEKHTIANISELHMVAPPASVYQKIGVEHSDETKKY